MTDATELFERTDKAFIALSEKSPGRELTLDYVRLHSQAAAQEVVKELVQAKLGNVTEADVHIALADLDRTLDTLIIAAKLTMTASPTNKFAELRNAIAEGQTEGYKLGRVFLKQDVGNFIVA